VTECEHCFGQIQLAHALAEHSGADGRLEQAGQGAAVRAGLLRHA